MKYINANALLPPALVRELQTYIQGGYLYIPADPAHPKPWGEVSGYRQELQRRNQKIRQAYRQGVSVEELADTYCLSIHAIRKILYQKQKTGVSRHQGAPLFFVYSLLRCHLVAGK